MNPILRIGLVALFVLSLLFSSAHETAVAKNPIQQTDSLDPQALLNAMSVDERIGQLFLVTFEGEAVGQDSAIADLILNYGIGGVVLLEQNNNMSGYGIPQNTPQQLAELTNNLQSLSLTGSIIKPTEEIINEQDLPPTPTPLPPAPSVPLLIAINHEGSPYDPNRILGGFTAVPTNMAIGATWKPAFAQAVGEVVGQELTSVGVNMLLGPTLDVLENPSPTNPADLGTTTFGGDPYWVGLLGQSYTTGVHVGSSNRVAVIAKHFPGKGSSDRLVDEEVPTVRKSLAQLQSMELAPFMAITGGATSETAVADGLLTTHIRYQGFQGNISDTTAPVSFDPQALETLMQLPEFSTWRQNKGIIVSDALGARSVERFYDDTEQEFPHRPIAKDALLAGNDLLYLGDFALGDAPYEAQLTNIKDTITWFSEKYQTDQSFQQRVDEAVLRILRLKLRQYNNDWTPENVLLDPSIINSQVEQGEAIMFDLARAGMTLIAPSVSELAERLASPPGAEDKVVIFTDVRDVRQCSGCPAVPIIKTTALEERLLTLYGPNASGQLQANQIDSFSFSDLADFLLEGGETIILPTAAPLESGSEETTPFPTPTPRPGYFVQEAIETANWIIFNLYGVNDESQVINQFLAERPDLVRAANVVVFAYDAPYYLDSTEISKLTAYFGVYSTSEPFIDTAARALFQESPLSGASPVSIKGIGYELFTQTQPDPQQIIELFILQDDIVQSPQSDAPLDATIGDTLQLQTGVIVDRNGNQVPDGTIVQFIQQDRIQGTVSIISEQPTTDGIARLGYVLEVSTGPGQFRITAVSGEAMISQAVDISITDESENEAQVAIIVPTLVPTATHTPIPTTTETAVPSATSTPFPTATPVPPPSLEPGIRIGLSEIGMLTAMLLGLAAVSGFGYWLTERQQGSAESQLSWLLWGIIGGLVVYIYVLLGLPGTSIFANIGNWAGLLSTIGGGLIGLTLYQIVRHRLNVFQQ